MSVGHDVRGNAASSLPWRAVALIGAVIALSVVGAVSDVLTSRRVNVASQADVLRNTALSAQIQGGLDAHTAEMNAFRNRSEAWAARLCARQEWIAQRLHVTGEGWPRCFAPVAVLPTSPARVTRDREAREARATRSPSPSPLRSPSPRPSASPSVSPSCATPRPDPTVPCVTPTPVPTP